MHKGECCDLTDSPHAHVDRLDSLTVFVGIPLATNGAEYLRGWNFDRVYGPGASLKARAAFNRMLQVRKDELGHKLGVGADEVRAWTAAEKKEKGRTLFGTLLNSAQALVIVGYPVGVISYYKAKGTTDWMRLLVIVIVHPIVMDLVVSSFRARSQNRYQTRSWLRAHSPALMESIFITCRSICTMATRDQLQTHENLLSLLHDSTDRRFMLASMRSPQLAILVSHLCYKS